MANTAPQPMKTVMPQLGVTYGLDLANEVMAGSQLPTGNLADDAVTTAKIDDDAVTSAKISPEVIQNISVPVSAAEIIAMSVTPKTIVPAPGAGFANILIDAEFDVKRTATAFTGGGDSVLEYASGGADCINVVADTVFTGAAGSQLVKRAGIDVATVPANSAIQLTNATAPFADGTGTLVVHVTYKTVPIH